MTSSQNSRVLTMVFTDLVDSTALKTARGDAAVSELIARHREHVTRLAADCSGRIIDWAGDGCFLTFETSSAAVIFGLKLQETHHWEAQLPRVRVGIHVGEVSEKAFNGGVRVEGLIVDLTARIGGLARAGQVLISGAVYQSARQRIGENELGKPIRWETYGLYTLKGFDEAVDVREAGFERISPLSAPPASEKAWPAGAEKAGSGKREIRKIAVLPFTNISDAPDQEWFVDGMTETLIAELAKIKALTVISRTSVMYYKKTVKPLREIARELGVHALVEGSVMRAGNRVRITAQLIDADTDAHLWAERYDGTMEEVLDLQSNVALAIAKQVNVALTPEEAAPLKQSRPVNPEAFDALMKARHLLHDATVAGFEESVKWVEQALAIDPEYADAYAWLAAIYAQNIIYGTVNHEVAHTRARVAAREAIHLGGESAPALAALGQLARITDLDWDQALAYGLRAVQLDPSDSHTQTLCGMSLMYMGQLEAARERLVRAMEIDPFQPLGYLGISSVMLAQRKPAEAIELLHGQLDKFPAYAPMRAALLLAHAQRGDWKEAAREGRLLLKYPVSPVMTLSLPGVSLAMAGDLDSANAVLAELRAHPPGAPAVSGGMAMVLQSLGHSDEAYPLFLQSYRKREFVLVWCLRLGLFDHPVFKNDARLQRLLDRYGIERSVGRVMTRPTDREYN